MTARRTDPLWLAINARLQERESGAKELALALGLALPAQEIGTAMEDPTAVSAPAHPVGWHHYSKFVESAAAQHGVPLDMFWRLLRTENAPGDPNAKSGKGAVGLAQFVGPTAEQYGVDPESPESSIYGAAAYLAHLHRQFGNWEDAVAAYNWGPGNMRKFLSGNSDMPHETSNYLKKVQPPSGEA